MGSTEKLSRGLIRGFATVFLMLGVCFLIIFVYFHPVYLTEVGVLSNTKQSGYITGITLAATIITKFTAAAVQELLAKRFDHEFENWRYGEELGRHNRRWQAILNVDDTVAKLRSLNIHIRYWIVALITTVLVASLSPRATSRNFPYQQEIRQGPSTQMSTVGNCTGVIDLPLSDPTWPYYWDIGNNKVFLVQTKQGDCPTRDAQMVTGNINTYDPENYAYMDAGVAVHRSAIGAPRSIYSPEESFAPGLRGVLGIYGGSLISTSQCSRVMVRNPISCHRGGSIAWEKPWLNISADNGLCSAYRQYSPGDWDHYNNGDGAMIKTMCAHGEIGQGTMVIGASGGYAHWLAVLAGDMNGALPLAADSTYVVTCAVDATAVFEYRELSLLLQNREASQARYLRFLNATGKRCAGPPISRDVVATAASANWQTLLQQAGADGWFDLVWEAGSKAHKRRLPPFGFAQSKNGLEDVLGLVAAMVTAHMNSSTSYTVNSTAVVEVARIGSGSRSSVGFCIPPLVVMLILIGLLLRVLGKPAPAFDCTNLEHLVTKIQQERETLKWTHPPQRSSY